MRGVSRHRASMPNRNDLCNQGFDPLSIIDNQVILLQFGGKRGSLYCEDILRSLRSGLTPRPANTEGRAFAVVPPLGRAAQLYARMEYLQVVENLVTEREQITLTGRDG